MKVLQLLSLAAALFVACDAKKPKVITEHVQGIFELKVKEHIRRGRDYFVMVYYPDCEGCGELIVELARLGLASFDRSRLELAKGHGGAYIDSHVEKFPTYLFYRDGNIDDVTVYEGKDFTAEGLIKFIEWAGHEVTLSPDREKMVFEHQDPAIYPPVDEGYHPDTDDMNGQLTEKYYAILPLTGQASELLTFDEVKAGILLKPQAKYIRSSIMSVAGASDWEHATDIEAFYNLFAWVDKLNNMTYVKRLPRYKPVYETRDISDHMYHLQLETYQDYLYDGRYWLVVISKAACKPCAKFSPLISEVANALGLDDKDFAVAQIDPVHEEALADRFHPQHYPTIFIRTPKGHRVDYDMEEQEDMMGFLERTKGEETGGAADVEL